MAPRLANACQRSCGDHASLRGRSTGFAAFLGVCVVAHTCCWSCAFALGWSCQLPCSIRRAGVARTLSSAGRLVTLRRRSRGGDGEGTFSRGDRVKALYEGDWYPGSIERLHFDGRFTVRWDDPDGGPEKSKLESESIQKFVVFKDYIVGDDVLAVSPDEFRWYTGTVIQGNGDGTFRVKWDDAGDGPETHDIDPEAMKRVYVRRGCKVNDTVTVKNEDDGTWWAGTIVDVNEDGTFTVKGTDPDSETVSCSPKDMKLPVSALKIGQKHAGVVWSLSEYGAWIDMGVENMGLLHISRVSEDRVRSMRDYVSEGHRVDVWISGIRPDGNFGVSLLEGLLGGSQASTQKRRNVAPFADVSPHEWFAGIVQTIVHNGAFVSVALQDGSTADGFLHVSSIRGRTAKFIENVDDELQIGQEIRVRIKSVDVEAGRMSVSMKDERRKLQKMHEGPTSAEALAPFVGISDTEWLIGTVRKIKQFGAFVKVRSPGGDASAEGLLHVKDILDDGFLERVEDELKLGQEIKVRITEIDPAKGKMRLSMTRGAFGW